MFDKNFGIEIEFTGVTRNKVVESLEHFFKRKCEEIVKDLGNGESYLQFSIEDDMGFKWLIHRDRSIVAERYKDDLCTVENIDNNIDAEEYKVELVSPVITCTSLTTLFSILSIIKSLGGIVNNSCGIHVHIDKPCNVKNLSDLVKKFMLTQDYVLSDFCVNDNRLDKYCRVFSQEFVSTFVNKQFEDIDELLEFYFNSLAPNESLSDLHNSSRYYSLNLHSLVKHNTVEFRFFNSSLEKNDIIRILDWVLHFVYRPEDCFNYTGNLKMAYNI